MAYPDYLQMVEVLVPMMPSSIARGVSRAGILAVMVGGAMISTWSAAASAAAAPIYHYRYATQYFVQGAEATMRVVSESRDLHGSEILSVLAGACLNVPAVVVASGAPLGAIKRNDLLIWGLDAAGVKNLKAKDLWQVRHLTKNETTEIAERCVRK
jgi:hypothetical protein